MGVELEATAAFLCYRSGAPSFPSASRARSLALGASGARLLLQASLLTEPVPPEHRYREPEKKDGCGENKAKSSPTTW